jgi:hypothetical protein
MPKQEKHADPTSLLGQLQRGRGEGYRRILRVPKRDAGDALLDCICNDPRLDSQIEDRAPYYAALAIEAEFELEPLLKYIRTYDRDDKGWDTQLAVGTLGELAKRGYKDAAQRLCDYLAWGQWWQWNLDNLCAVENPDLHERITTTIEERFPLDSDLEEALDWFYLDSEPWTTLARHSARISNLATKPNKRAQAAVTTLVPSNLESLNAGQLLDVADDKSWGKLRKLIKQAVKPSDMDLLKQSVSLDRPFRATVALAGLTTLAPISILPWLLDFWSANPGMPPYLRSGASEVMVALPSNLTLPLARERLNHQVWHERRLAETLFKAHTTVEDIPLLRSAIANALQDDEENCYRVCNLVEAFSNIPNCGPVPELTDVFVQFRYSYGRAFAAEAIHVTAPDFFRENFATECLWDCEERTRLLGARAVHIDNETAHRLRRLASDPWEDNEVRAEAARRSN